MLDLGKPRFLGRHVMMKKEYAEALLTGRKRATIRLGIVKPKAKEVLLHSGGKIVAKLVIRKVYHKRFRELNKRDAKLDGYSTARELKKELAKIYGRVSPDAPVTVIVFEVVQRFDKLEEEDRWRGLNPIDIARMAVKRKLPLSEEEKKILETLVKTGSIRKAAYILFGDVGKRHHVRRALRRALELLIEQGVIGKLS